MNCATICRKAGLMLVAGAGIVGAAGPECAISGRITDQRGVPTGAAAVTAVRAGAPGFGQEETAGGATTDDRGSFCVTDLRPGRYFIRASARSHPPSASPACAECCSAGSEFVPGYYGGAQKQSSRQAVWVENGRTVSEVMVVLRRAAAYCVPGEVRDAAGALRGDVDLALDGAGWSASVLNYGGRFLLTSLLPGDYLLVVKGRGSPDRVLAREVIRVSGKGGRIVVRLH